MKFINKMYRKVRTIFSGKYPKLYRVCENRKSEIKFFFAGASAAFINLLFLIIFHGWFKWGLVLSTSLAFLLSFFLSFTLQKFWTFRNYHYDRITIQFALYIINALIGLSVNGYLMYFLVNRWGLWYLLAQVVVNVLIGLYNFFIYNFVIFRKKIKNENCSV